MYAIIIYITHCGELPAPIAIHLILNINYHVNTFVITAYVITIIVITYAVITNVFMYMMVNVEYEVNSYRGI